MLTDKQIIEIKATIDKAVLAFADFAKSMADLFPVFCEKMCAEPEYIPNSSLKQIGGHYFGLWWYSDVSEVTVLPVDPIIRQYPVSCFVAIPLELIGASVEPRPPPKFRLKSSARNRPGCHS